MSSHAMDPFPTQPGGRVLVIAGDDERPRLIRRVNVPGLQVRSATDIPGARAAIREAWPDLVVIDRRLPASDAIAAAVLRMSTRLPVVILPDRSADQGRPGMMMLACVAHLLSR